MRLFLPQKKNGYAQAAQGKRKLTPVTSFSTAATEKRQPLPRNGDQNECTVEKKSPAEYARLFLACGNAGDYLQGKLIHRELQQTNSRLDQDAYIGNILITMYRKCDKPQEAQEAFTRIVEPNVISWSSLIAVYAAHGKFQESVKLFQVMLLQGVPPNNVTFVNLLKAFNSRHQLVQGRLLHAVIVESGYESESFVGATVMNMYVKCGSLADARLVFDRISHAHSAPWSVLMAGFVSQARKSEAVTTFYLMCLEGVMPDKIAFLNVMTACSVPELLPAANRIYGYILEHECRTETVVVNAAVNMFAKCGGGLRRAREIFDCPAYAKTSASWNTMIGIYIELGFEKEALTLFRYMLLDGASAPDQVTFARLFAACGDPGTFEALVNFMVEGGIELDMLLQTVIVKLYGVFGELDNARNMFDGMPRRDCVLWNVMISAHISHQDFGGACLLFHQMLLEGERPDRFTLVSTLEAYSRLAADAKAKRQHQQLLDVCAAESGLAADALVCNAVVSVNGKSGQLVEAERAFNRLGGDVVSWNAIMGAFAEGGYWEEALQLFRRMQLQGEKANDITLMAALAALSGSDVDPVIMQEAQKIHACIRESGLESSLHVSNSLIHMYAKCWLPCDAEAVFWRMDKRDVVSWTALLSAYDERREEEDSVKALACLRKMRLEGVAPSKVTLTTALSIFAKQKSVRHGRVVHQHVQELGYEGDAEVASSLIDMYGECGRWQEARQVFEEVAGEDRDVVLWNSLISAFSKDVCAAVQRQVMTLLRSMLMEGCKPSRVTLALVLDGLSECAALEEGIEVDRMARELGLESETGVGTGLVCLYGKCGKLAESSSHFERIAWHRSSSTAWNVFMAACARHGAAESVKCLFHGMQLQGIHVANCTFVSLLSAFSHCGDVEAACRVFQDMEVEFGVLPGSIEKGCLVDLLGRSGLLVEAERVAVEVKGEAWAALLASCTLHGDGGRGSQAVERLHLSESALLHSASTYVTLANGIRRSPS